ncbi:hypothetical protein HZ326_4616 [Fusarium oxysporum f. sp. albedinis]|nr:hypothetical protein HZ326_4616 [Fusarium oxysporum f. sp. albedinis]
MSHRFIQSYKAKSQNGTCLLAFPLPFPFTTRPPVPTPSFPLFLAHPTSHPFLPSSFALGRPVNLIPPSSLSPNFSSYSKSREFVGSIGSDTPRP